MLNSIQYLRGIAAAMVVFYHVLAPSARLEGSEGLPVFYAGQGGVDLFFVISGFIIWHTTRSQDADGMRFLVRRLKRVAPLYWVLTLALTLVAIFLPSVLGATEFDLDHVIASLLFVPWPHPNLSEMNPVLFVGWSLNYEMAFYLVFALLIAFTPYIRGFIAIAFGIALAGLGLAIDDRGIMDFYTAPIILEFLFGIAIAMVYSTRLALPRSVCGVFVVGGFAAMVWLGSPDLDRIVWAGLPSLAIMTGAVFWEKDRAVRPLMLPMLLGAASYSIYLSHVFIVPISQALWTFGLPAVVGWWAPAYAVAATLACLTAGIATYLVLEIPLSHVADWVDDRLSPSRRGPGKPLATRYTQALRP